MYGQSLNLSENIFNPMNVSSVPTPLSVNNEWSLNYHCYLDVSPSPSQKGSNIRNYDRIELSITVFHLISNHVLV